MKPVTEKDLNYAREQYRKYLNYYGKDHSSTKMWRATILRLNNRFKEIRP